MDYCLPRVFAGRSILIPLTAFQVARLKLPCSGIQATYIMFHFVEGVPFESNSGVWDRLTMWEQIDGGAQYTPTKKWLTCLPIGL